YYLPYVALINYHYVLSDNSFWDRFLVYIKSELQLAKLKIEKNIDSPIGAYSNFIMRSLPRLLPTYMLSKVYKKLRK
ncbi:hypothetical protein ABQD47_15045, partial [Providencia rettgeri]